LLSIATVNVLPVLIQKGNTMLKALRGFPRVVLMAIPFPLNKILELAFVPPVIKDALEVPEDLTLNFQIGWGRTCPAV